MKIKIILTLLILGCFSAFAQDNPYDIYGHKSNVVYETRVSDYLLIKNKDTTSLTKTIALNIENGVVLFLGINDSILDKVKISPEQLLHWLSVDPHTSKYPSLSPYNFVGNTPIWAIDPSGRDIIVLSAPDNVGGNGHAAVLIGNDTDGWTFYSKNGTYGSVSGSKSSGEANKTPQNGVPYKTLTEWAKTENTKDGVIEYKAAFRITSSVDVDNKMKEAASTQVASWYDVTGIFSGSCIDVASDALKAGGFDPGYIYSPLNQIPNDRYNQIKKNNEGSDATKSILPDQKSLDIAKEKYKAKQKNDQNAAKKAVEKQLNNAFSNPALDKRQGGGIL